MNESIANVLANLSTINLRKVIDNCIKRKFQIKKVRKSIFNW